MNQMFHLDRSRRKLFGVCSGLGAYTNTDPIFWRLGFIAATLMFGFPIIVYIAAGMLAD